MVRQLVNRELIRRKYKKHILVLASTFPRWAHDSTPPFVFELEKRLSKQFTITVLAPYFHGAKKNEIMENIAVHRFQYFWPTNFQKLCYDGGILPNLKKNKLLYFQAVTLVVSEFIAAIKIIRNQKIDLIHAHWIIPQGIIAFMMKKLFGIPYIVTTHGGDIYGLQNGFLIKMKKAVLKNASKITVVSNAIKKEMEKKNGNNLDISIISMGVDGTKFNPKNYEASLKKKYFINGPFLLFVGRLAEKKGVAYLIHAMPIIIKEFPTSKLLIIGEGAITKELKKLSKNLHLDDTIIFVGAVPNSELPKYYATADIFIGPSIQTEDGDTEGLGLTFVEASFSGAVPVGTNIGGISDVIIDKKTGLLIPQKDSQSIAEAVISLLKDKKFKETLKDNARKTLLPIFDWEFVAQKYSHIYAYYENNI